MKKHVAKALTLILLLPVIFIGCQKAELIDGSNDANSENTGFENLKNTNVYCGTPVIGELVDFEQTINAGIVTVGNDETNLIVTYELTGDWWIQNAVLFAGPASEAGTINPDGTGIFEPGSWNPLYKHIFYPWDYVQSHTFVVDLSTLEDCFIVVAYANAKNLATGENKFIFGKPLPGSTKTPGYYLNYCKQECTVQTTCETAYAYGKTYSNCFLTIPGVNSNNWGWSNGPIGQFVDSWPIYAGAGQCIFENGTLVGTLEVNYTPPTAVITFSMNPGFVLNETHLYVGSMILPLKNGKFTTAPGQFPYKHGDLNGVSSDTFTINGLSGNIYIAAHSEVCGVYE